jgi:hypothetical protein
MGERPPLPGTNVFGRLSAPQSQQAQQAAAAAALDDTDAAMDNSISVSSLDCLPPSMLTSLPQVATLLGQCWSPAAQRRPTAAYIMKTLLQLQAKHPAPST